MPDINVEQYKDRMLEIMARHNVDPGNFFFEDNPPMRYAISRCAKIEAKIFFKRTVTEEDRNSYIQGLTRQFEDKIGLLDDDWMLIKHSLLHEICHIIARYRDDYECSKWAFYEMKK